MSEKVENGLNQGEHQFLPALAKGDESAFSAKCGKINANTYEFKRSINLPGRAELESKIKQKFNGVDDEIRKRLNKGVIFLRFNVKRSFQIRSKYIIFYNKIKIKTKSCYFFNNFYLLKYFLLHIFNNRIMF